MRVGENLLRMYILSTVGSGSSCNCGVVGSVTPCARVSRSALCPVLEHLRTNRVLAICSRRRGNELHGCCHVAGGNERHLRSFGGR